MGKLHSQATSNNHISQFSGFLSPCYELIWFLNSKSNLYQAVDNAVKQIYSLSALLLFYFTMVLLSAQVIGLAVILSGASTLPIGLQFMFGAFLIILATAFKIMYR